MKNRNCTERTSVVAGGEVDLDLPEETEEHCIREREGIAQQLSTLKRDEDKESFLRSHEMALMPTVMF